MVCTYNNVHMSRVSHNMPLVSLTSITSKCQGSIIGVRVESLCGRLASTVEEEVQAAAAVRTKYWWQLNRSTSSTRNAFDFSWRDALRLFRGLSAESRPCAISLTGSMTEKEPLCGAAGFPLQTYEQNIILLCFFFFTAIPASALAHIDPIIVIDKYHLRLVHFLCTNYIHQPSPTAVSAAVEL